jgi:hypothetical protein
MSFFHPTDHHRHTRLVRIDDGRKLLTLTALAAGGAVLAISVVGVIYGAIFAARTPIEVDIVAAAAGAVVSYIFLLRAAHLSQRDD